MCYVIRVFEGLEIRYFDPVYLKKDKYFERQYRRDVLNDALNDILYFKCKVSDKEKKGRLLKRFFLDML